MWCRTGSSRCGANGASGVGGVWCKIGSSRCGASGVGQS